LYFGIAAKLELILFFLKWVCWECMFWRLWENHRNIKSTPKLALLEDFCRLPL